jgi:hypothetical protein
MPRPRNCLFEQDGRMHSRVRRFDTQRARDEAGDLIYPTIDADAYRARCSAPWNVSRHTQREGGARRWLVTTGKLNLPCTVYEVHTT